MRIRRSILGVLLCLPFVACAQDVGRASPPSTSGTAQPTKLPSASPAPAATAQFPAPAELQGIWVAVMDSGSDIELEIRETSFRITAANPLGASAARGTVVSKWTVTR